MEVPTKNLKNIQFRIWSTERKEFIPSGVLTQEGNIKLSEDGDKPLYYPQLIPTLWTGYFDGNGIPIYVGDIVKADWGYADNMCIVTLEDYIYANCECIISDQIEIVGNIFENPELIKT